MRCVLPASWLILQIVSSRDECGGPISSEIDTLKYTHSCAVFLLMIPTVVLVRAIYSRDNLHRIPRAVSEHTRSRGNTGLKKSSLSNIVRSELLGAM